MVGENDAPQTFKRGPQRAVVIETESAPARTGARSDHLAATQSDKVVDAALKLVGKLYGRDGVSLGGELSDTGTVEETMKFLDVISKPEAR
jgi:hypothetical protein